MVDVFETREWSKSLSQNPYNSEENAVSLDTSKGDSIFSILPLCFLIALTALHAVVYAFICVVLAVAKPDSGFELALIEVVTMTAVTIGLILRQEWARIMLIVNAYTMLAVALYFVLFAKRDDGGVLAAVYLVFGALALLMIVLAHWSGKVTKEASIPKSYIYRSPGSHSGKESDESQPPTIST